MRYLLPGVVLTFGLITSVQSAVAEESHEALSTFKDCDLCPEMVVIPAGIFMMGLPEVESSQRQVSIVTPFAIGKFEVTFDEWDVCVTAGSCDDAVSDRGWGRGRRPVMMVTWLGAKPYGEWLSERTGKSYRLPSDAEWEYAARAGTTSNHRSYGLV
jgi:formylglycine-generating enzyme required for sulfatase activity